MLKDKKITIIKKETYRDEANKQQTRDVIVANNIWSYYRHVSSKEYLSAGATRTGAEVIFVINYNKDVEIGMIIKFRDINYKIESIDDYEGYIDNLKIVASKTR